MKKIAFAAIIIAAAFITLASCKWFSNSQSNKFSIVGKWKVDTVYKEGLANDTLKELIATVNVKGNNGEVYKFNADNTLNRLSLKDSKTEYYYFKESLLFFKELNNNNFPHTYHIINDSTFSFINKDSVVFILKRE